MSAVGRMGLYVIFVKIFLDIFDITIPAP